MAVKRKTRKRRAVRGSLLGLWLMVLLVVLGGGAWYFWTQRESAPDEVATEARPPATRPAPAESETPVEAPDRFSFYNSLPQAEVPIAEDGTRLAAGNGGVYPKELSRGGIYGRQERAGNKL